MICVMLYVPGTDMVFTAVIIPNTCDYSAAALLRLLLTLVMVLCIGAALYLLLLLLLLALLLLLCIDDVLLKSHYFACLRILMSDEIVIRKRLHFATY